MKTVPGTETRIQVVYPKPQQHIYEDSTFLMGQVKARPHGAKLFANGKLIPLSEQGFFSFKHPVHAGLNPVQLEVRESEAVPPIAQELFALYGEPPYRVLPASPLAVHEETLLPAEDVWLQLDDTITVACSASEDAEVSLSIPWLTDMPVPIPPFQSEQAYVDTREIIFAQPQWNTQRIPVRGYYQARIPVRQLLPHGTPASMDKLKDLPLVLRIQSGQQSMEITLPGRLTVMEGARPVALKTDREVTRTAPVNGARLTPQRAGTVFELTSLQSGWAGIRLSREEQVFLPIASLSTDATRFPDRALSVIRAESQSPHRSKVRLSFHPITGQAGNAAPCPILIESLPSERMNRLQVRLYGVCSHCDFIHYPPNDQVIRQIHWRQVADTVLELWIDLVRPLAGYDYEWQDGGWVIQVKSLPEKLSDVQVLIDPGHGGTESGSVGLNGLPEKSLNLTVSRLLRDALVKEGFQVRLTRDADQTLSLQERGHQVETTQPDIVLSLHHNALPDGRDPQKEVGACCFYYHAFSKPLAQTLLSGLTESLPGLADVPNYGLFYDSLYMTRIHQALAVLVEVGFFTNLQEFERLIDPKFQQEVAQRLASALRNYCLG